MKSRLAALLACAPIVFGQPSKVASTAPDQVTRYVDFVALDDAGRPVPDLDVQSLEVAQSGHPRKIAGLTRFDTRLHTARASGPTAFPLVPDEIKRNFVAIVDDLGLSVDGIAAVQETLRAFAGRMESGDRMAVLRTSSGTGVSRQLTSDPRILGDAIERIQFLGGNVTERTAAGAGWLTLSHALQGLQQLRGRKFVVLFSQHLRAAVIDSFNAASLLEDANSAMATVYGVNPGGPVPPGASQQAQSPLEKLAVATGGAFDTDFFHVLQAEQSFYVLAFEEPPPPNSPLPSAWNDPPLLTVRRPGITLRPRSRVLALATQEDFPAPTDRPLQIRRAMLSPFEGAGIHMRLTSTFTSFVPQSAVVDAGMLIDARDLSVICDANHLCRGAVRIAADARSDTGQATIPIERALDLVMPAAEYQRALRDGLLFTMSLRLPSPGVWRIRAMVADGVSDRIGTSAQCIWIPARDEFAISSLILRSAGQQSDPARNFKTGQALEFLYDVFQPMAGESHQAQLEVRTRLYVHGHAVFVGAPMQVAYPVSSTSDSRKVTGHLSLAKDTVPGDYILEVTVIDKLSPTGAPRSATQFIDFRLHD
jgi:VWFA-related protein